MSWFDPSTNTYRDNAGTIYQTPDNKPAASGTYVTSYQNGQKVQGQIIGSFFVPVK